ncbi:hypothetical protein BEL04_04160 [Mucilaginibacter sp. PPCGB 2223]|nr:hypothetical protein BEL04_04160 [Mucilaginibacter sp. PPCGB 2223]
MLAAAIYNLFWGAVISIHPQLILFGNAPTPYILILIRCIGMLVGVYGVAYYFCSRDPVRYWPLILVGLIGKVLGPIGAACYVTVGAIPASFLWVNVFNDLIWIGPFGWILHHIWKNKLT